MFKVVNGVEVPLTEAEIHEIEQREAAHAADLAVQAIKLQIERLEQEITARRLREALLGTDNGWLAEQDAKIAELRAQL